MITYLASLAGLGNFHLLSLGSKSLFSMRNITGFPIRYLNLYLPTKSERWKRTSHSVRLILRNLGQPFEEDFVKYYNNIFQFDQFFLIFDVTSAFLVLPDQVLDVILNSINIRFK